VSYTAASPRLPIIEFPATTMKGSTMNRSVLVRGACAAAVVALTLGGCAKMRSSPAPQGAQSSPSAQGAQAMQVYEASLAGTQEVPPVSTTATGSAEVRYNPGTSMLSWSVTHSGLSGAVTGAHIHGPAGPGQNAGVVVPFTNVSASPITGEARITAEQAGQLSSGQWYVNLHTAANPNGEIRGQLRPRR
jgi:hypothetical protein